MVDQGCSGLRYLAAHMTDRAVAAGVSCTGGLLRSMKMEPNAEAIVDCSSPVTIQPDAEDQPEAFQWE